MGLGAIEAIEEAGLKPGKDIKIVTIDAVHDGMVALSQGKINFIAECSPLLGPQLMDARQEGQGGPGDAEADRHGRDDLHARPGEGGSPEPQVLRTRETRRYRGLSSSFSPGSVAGHPDTMSTPVLQMRAIDKRFGDTKALDAVDFRLLPGEVHALMGENGAGKSTLMKVLTGVYFPDAGEIELHGTRVEFAHPLEAQRAGVSTVYQEVNLCPNLSVAENISIGREPRRFGHIMWREVRRRAADALERVGVDVDVRAPLGGLVARRPADGRDRTRDRHLGGRAHPRRADVEPRPGRGRAALHPDPRAQGARDRGRVHLALPRAGVRDHRADHRPSQRAARRRVEDERAPPVGARLEDARPGARVARGARTAVRVGNVASGPPPLR